MESTLFDQIKKTIESYDRIIIHRHVRPDPDAIGSQVGLKEILKETYPNKEVYAVGSLTGNLDFLATMDEVEDEAFKDALVIVTDTANASRISDQRYQMADKVIKIDHHPLNDEGYYGDIMWVEETASSCSEMVADLALNQLKDWKMNDGAARLLYAGIVGDTNRFLYDATSPKTMALAGQLMTYDFDHVEVNDQMNALDPKEARLIAYFYQNLVVLSSGMAYLIIDQEVLDELGITEDQTQAVVSLPRNIQGVVAWGIFVQQVPGHYRCRLRSNGPQINDIAEEHGGGGHRLASGANAKDTAEIEEIISKMSERTMDWLK